MRQIYREIWISLGVRALTAAVPLGVGLWLF